MTQSYTTAFEIYKAQGVYTDALRVAQKMNDMDLITQCMNECKDSGALKQMAFMLGRQRNPYESEDETLNSLIA
jgi:hypothetical protein